VPGAQNYMAVAEEFPRWSEDTAQRYMATTTAFGDQIPHRAVFQIDAGALYYLARPSIPEPIRIEMIERAGSQILKGFRISLGKRCIFLLANPSPTRYGKRQFGGPKARPDFFRNSGRRVFFALLQHSEPQEHGSRTPPSTTDRPPTAQHTDHTQTTLSPML